jgi:hypothetical protein
MAVRPTASGTGGHQRVRATLPHVAAEFTPCATWADPEAFSVCEPGDIRPELLADAISVATSILYAKTGRQFPGPCTDVWRPDGCGCQHRSRCVCRWYPSIELRSQPVVAVSEVKIDGDVLPASAWRLGDPDTPAMAGWLYRVDGELWPCCQDIALEATEPDTWQVTYTWGASPPAGADLMTQILACELVKGWTGGKCRLGRGFTSITRENLSASKSDPSFLAASGLLGIPEVDEWVAAVNPSGADRPPKVLNPDLVGLGHDPTVRRRTSGW